MSFGTAKAATQVGGLLPDLVSTNRLRISNPARGPNEHSFENLCRLVYAGVSEISAAGFVSCVFPHFPSTNRFYTRILLGEPSEAISKFSARLVYGCVCEICAEWPLQAEVVSLRRRRSSDHLVPCRGPTGVFSVSQLMGA